MIWTETLEIHVPERQVTGNLRYFFQQGRLDYATREQLYSMEFGKIGILKFAAARGGHLPAFPGSQTQAHYPMQSRGPTALFAQDHFAGDS